MDTWGKAATSRTCRQDCSSISKQKVEPLQRQNMQVGCTGWTNNACKSINHALKQRTQWHINQLPELIEKCCTLVDAVDAQYKEANCSMWTRGRNWCGNVMMKNVQTVHGV